ncbi:MAG TPA: VOC family protein [Verrucomicrobiae bacterium]|nr:VOC family protein [Verrucomicrobiae bacterium]
MPALDKLMMIAIGVKNMPEAKEFYAEKLGLKVATDYRQDDDHWWVSLTLPEGGVTITLTTYHENATPGTMTLWFATSDLQATHKQFSDQGVEVNDIKDDLHGPGSGVKWFNFKDPDGTLIHVEQA